MLVCTAEELQNVPHLTSRSSPAYLLRYDKGILCFWENDYTSLPSAIRGPAVWRLLPVISRSNFHTTSTSRASILFALGALSNSRETQHFNKLSRLSRIEHSPPLKLIQSSEVEPFPLPTPPKPSPPSAAWRAGTIRDASKIWDEKALNVGRALLADQARRTHWLQRSLGRAKRRELKKDVQMKKERLIWQEERRKLRNEMRAAGVWILVSISVATMLATWRFWPQKEAVQDSGQLGRKLAARAAASMPLPAAVSSKPVDVSPAPAIQGASADVAFPQKHAANEVNQPVLDAQQSSATWWKGLFWKQ
ncbi:hypothetical protein LTR37_001364 [Vermiconidia calcicola]|uniref:Uncharacterized protein n=1 Tax=Vermiconidia calcicola TaxID=1690605 RepID=A0ACC3NVR5_9PEZI|nr:hypothetical protein LTR37_001364 [Vermiconidia calcicola]